MGTQASLDAVCHQCCLPYSAGLTQDIRGVRIGDKHHGKYEDKADYGAVSKSSKAHESSLRSGGSTGKGDMKF